MDDVQFFKHPSFSGGIEKTYSSWVFTTSTNSPPKKSLVFIFITILAVGALAGGWAYVIGIPVKGDEITLGRNLNIVNPPNPDQSPTNHW